MAQARRRASLSVVVLLLVLLLGLIFALWPAAPLSGNGSHEDSIEAYYGAAGDYVVRVEAIPIVGDLHLVVYVTEKNDTPVQGATVEAVGTGPGDSPLRIGPARNIPQPESGPQTEYNPSFYSVTLPGALEEGVWDITLEITPQGQAESEELVVDFPIELREPSAYNELIIAVLAAFVLFLVFMLFSWRRQAARRRRAG